MTISFISFSLCSPGKSAAVGRRRVRKVHISEANAYHTWRTLRTRSGERVPARYLSESDQRHAGAGRRTPEARHCLAQSQESDARRRCAQHRQPTPHRY